MVKDYLALVVVEVLEGARGGAKPRWTSARVQFTIYHTRKNHILDSDNALGWMKRTIDGLTLAGIFSDDKILTHLPPLHIVDKKRKGEIDIEIDPGPEVPSSRRA